MANIQAKNALDQINAKGAYGSSEMSYSQAVTALKSGELNDTVLAIYNAQNNTAYTKENPPPIYKPAEGSGNGGSDPALGGIMSEQEFYDRIGAVNRELYEEYKRAKEQGRHVNFTTAVENGVEKPRIYIED